MVGVRIKVSVPIPNDRVALCWPQCSGAGRPHTLTTLPPLRLAVPRVWADWKALLLLGDDGDFVGEREGQR
jgi:hypothetical protein